MQFTVHPDHIEIRLEGEIDSKVSTQLKADLMAQLAKQNHDVVIDLSDVRYIDSGAINLFITVHRELLAKARKLTLRNCTPSVERILKLGHLDKVLNLA